MRMGTLISLPLWILIGLYSSGCAGVELGGKMGLYAVEDRQETQVTKSRARPLKCMWSDCGSMEASGS